MKKVRMIKKDPTRKVIGKGRLKKRTAPRKERGSRLA